MSTTGLRESGLEASPVKVDEPHASQEPADEESTGRSKFSNICDYLFKNRTSTDEPTSDKKAQKRCGRYPRPEPDLELKYPLIDIKELDESVVETYNKKVREMSKRLSGPLRASGRVGTGTFTRDLAEEIVGTDLQTRSYLDHTIHGLLEEVRCAAIEEHELEWPREMRWGPLESRPSFLSQRINEDEEYVSAYRPGEKKRGKQRVS